MKKLAAHIAKYISAYHPRYVRSLVYMLQSCEYSIREAYLWSMRIGDFARVEHRSCLDMTPKAVGLLAIGWISELALLAAAAYSFASGGLLIATAIIDIVLLPLLVALIIVIALGAIRLAQMPVERAMISRARKILAAHKGVKIAIAGSYGKTSMREILKTVLSAGKRVASPGHNHNTPISIARFARTLRGDEEIVIFELGEYYPGDIAKLCAMVQPQIGIVTGVSEAHLERFGTIDKAADTIFELAQWPGLTMLCVNGESDIALRRARPGDIIYSREGVDGWSVRDAKSDLGGTAFSFARKDARVSAMSSLLGLHQIGPLALAAYLAHSFGMKAADIETGLSRTKPFPRRLELKPMENGAYKLDDSYNGNPAGVAAVIAFLAGLKGHRRFYVTPGLVEMGSGTADIHRKIGEQIAAAGIEKTVLIRDARTPYIEEGLKAAGYKGEIIWFDESLKAFAALPHMTVSGDVILLQNDLPDQYA